MKKLFIFALATVLAVMFTLPAAAAVKHEFGGYWRTRFYSYDNLDYADNSSSLQAIDTRTRLFYTAVLHDNLKFINQFEMDAIWGANPKDSSYGDRGADAVAVEVKRTFIDANWANLRWRIGTQGFQDPSGGYVFDDDMTGMKIDYRAASMTIGLWWLRSYEGYGTTQFGGEGNGVDFDTISLILNYKAGNMRWAPFLTYMRTNDGGGFEGTAGEPLDLYFAGLRWDMKMGNWDFYAIGIYEGGSYDDTADVSAYVFDAEARVKLGNWGAWGRFMYVSGDDDTTDDDIEQWAIPSKLASMSNWAELWGDGSFDVTFPDGSTGKEVTDLMNFGLGAWMNPTKAWTLKLAWWYLNFAQDGANSSSGASDKNIGNEIDFWATYSVMQAMKLHFIFSYLIVGDAIEEAVSPVSAEDPWELGAQLEIKF